VMCMFEFERWMCEKVKGTVIKVFASNDYAKGTLMSTISETASSGPAEDSPSGTANLFARDPVFASMAVVAVTVDLRAGRGSSSASFRYAR